MSCCGSRESSPEYNKQFKPENNSGCCNGKNSPDCDVPSKAIEGSARWEWEQKYGKLVTNIKRKIGPDGRFFLEVIKKPCEKPGNRSERKECCSVRYRVARQEKIL